MHALGRRSVILVAISLAASGRADVMHFTESAAARGFVYSNLEGMFGGTGQYGCGVALCDLDNDGDDDLLATGGSPSMVVYANNGAGYFTNVTATAGLGAPTKPSGLVCADYDGDGDLDIFLTRWLQPAILYRNNGGLNFTNVTSAAGITGTSGAGAGASFGDFDADGDLDLAIAMRTLTLSNMLRNRFFRNEGNGTFTEISAQLGVDDAGASFQCLLQDLDRDGDCDLYVSNDKGTPTLPNRYFRNEGGIFVSEPNNGACIAIDSMGVYAGDVDMNGYVDIYCANTGDGHALLLTDTARIYTESADIAGVAGQSTGWGTVVFDPDNDADQDIFIVSMLDKPDYLFMNEGGFPFNDRSSSVGLGDGIDTYCIAVSDIDRDGDLDILSQPYLATLDLFINTAPAANNAIQIKVLGHGKNTHAGERLVTPLGELAGRDAELAAERVERLSAEEPQDDLGLAAAGPTALVLAVAFVGSARAPRSLRRRRRLVSWLLHGVVHCALESQTGVSGNCAAHQRDLHARNPLPQNAVRTPQNANAPAVWPGRSL